MATITRTYEVGTGAIVWAGIATGDTVNESKIPAGTYVGEVKGTFNGGTSVTLLFSPKTGPTTAIKQFPTDSSPITITAASGAFQFGPTCAGYFKPAVASGSADSITVTLVPARQASNL